VTIATTGKRDIWVYDLPRGTLTRLTFQGSNFGPVWTPDGKRATFANADAGKSSLAWVLADGSGPPETLAQTEQQRRPTSWSPDGKLLAFEGGPRGQSDILLLPLPDGRGSEKGVQGCHSQGATEQEAIENIGDAIREYLAALRLR